MPVSCPGCGGRLKANGRAPRRLVTLVGEVELRRQRYRCLHCGSEVVPLDGVLGLEPRVQHTLGVQKRDLWLVTEMSDQKAVDVAAELRRWSIGRGELHRWVADEGPGSMRLPLSRPRRSSVTDRSASATDRGAARSG